MEHRRPDPGCPLCGLWGLPYKAASPNSWGRQHEHAEALWNECDGRADWAERVCWAAKQAGADCTSAQARRHFGYHRPEQPAPSGKLDRRKARAAAAELSPLGQQILTALYRTRMLSRSQILELFFGERPKASARTLATKELHRLIHGHLAYRFYPETRWASGPGMPAGLKNEVFYLFGRNGQPFIEDRFELKVWPDSYTTMASQVGKRPFLHDSRANEVYVAFCRALRRRGNQLQLPNGEMSRAFSKPENWYGARMIGMNLWSRRLMEELKMRPDGFASLSLERSGYEDDSLPSSQLPFFYEFDNQSKQAHVVAEQMLAYHHLALSGETGRRFPDLAVEGYAVPMVMIFRGRGRVEEIARSFRRRAQKDGYRDGGVPIFLTTDVEWMKDPFAPGILRHAWEAESAPLSLLEALIRSSARLLEARTLTASQTLELDTKSARRSRQAVKDAKAQPGKKAAKAPRALAAAAPASPKTSPPSQPTPEPRAPEPKAIVPTPHVPVDPLTALLEADESPIERRRKRPARRGI